MASTASGSGHSRHSSGPGGSNNSGNIPSSNSSNGGRPNTPNGGMDELLPLVLQLTNPDQVRCAVIVLIDALLLTVGT